MGTLLRGAERKTLRRFGGKLQSANCRGRCCGGAPGDCATIRRYNRCPSYPEIEGCQTEPDHIWVCEYPNDPNTMPVTFREGNSCYSQTDISIPTVEIPTGDVLMVGWPTNRPLGCADPECTTCQQFYVAEACPGQNVSGLPLVYVRVEIVPTPAPGQDCAGVSVDWPDRGRICYTVKPGTMYNRPHIDATGGYLHPDYTPLPVNFKCCLCVQDCAEVPLLEFSDCGLGQRTINLRCCCSDEWTATVTVSWTEKNTGITPAGDVQEFTRSLQGTVLFRSTDPIGTPHTLIVHETATLNGQPDPSVLTQDYPLAIPFSPCAPGPVQHFGAGFCPAGGSWSIISPSDPNDIQRVVRSDDYLTCNTYAHNYHFQYFAGNQPGGIPRIDNVFTYSATVRHTGRCGGGCGQAGGQSGDRSVAVLAAQQARADRVAVKSVPRSDWPLWAKAVELGRADTDRGVGDTIKRTLGAGGEAFEVWYMRVVGKSCGCSDRVAHLNALYPYGAAP